MTTRPDGVPRAMLHNMLHNKVLHERVILLNVDLQDIPHVDETERMSAGRTHMDVLAGKVLGEGRSHLGPRRVVLADEENLGNAPATEPAGAREGTQGVPGMLVHQDGQELRVPADRLNLSASLVRRPKSS